jgi:hypothetical protein
VSPAEGKFKTGGASPFLAPLGKLSHRCGLLIPTQAKYHKSKMRSSNIGLFIYPNF